MSKLKSHSIRASNTAIAAAAKARRVHEKAEAVAKQQQDSAPTVPIDATGKRNPYARLLASLDAERNEVSHG